MPCPHGLIDKTFSYKVVRNIWDKAQGQSSNIYWDLQWFLFGQDDSLQKSVIS